MCAEKRILKDHLSNLQKILTRKNLKIPTQSNWPGVDKLTNNSNMVGKRSAFSCKLSIMKSMH